MNHSATEQRIIQGLQNGEKEVLNLLYEHYANSLYGVIMKVIKDDAIAQDVLQDTFIKVWKNGQTYNPEKAKLFTWLYRIAKNSSIDKVRSLQKKSYKNIQIEESNVYLLAVKSLNQDVMDIQTHLSTLEEKYQVVLNALYFKGMTHEEASEALDIPLGTVKSRLKIGLRELKKIYDE